MTAEDEVRIAELGSKAAATLLDALKPIIGPKGIIGVSLVALVAIDGFRSFPVRLVLGTNTDVVATVLRAHADHARRPMSAEDRFTVEVPVKQ